MAVVLWVAAVALFTAALLLEGGAGAWEHVVGQFAAWTGPLVFLAAVAYTLRGRFMGWARDTLVDMAGPAVIASMPPRQVLDSALARVFGDGNGHDEIITALLGGGGRHRDGLDTAISRRTTAHIELDRIGKLCESNITWSHELAGVGNNHYYVIFGTSDRSIYTSVTNDRVYPLYEVWFFPDELQLDEFVPTLRDQLQFGVSYSDEVGDVHLVAPRPEQGDVVTLADYDRYVRLPEGLDPADLRILKVDLYNLVHDDHVVDHIEAVTVRASNIGPDLGFLTWSVPHPCFVTTVTFDVSRMATPDHRLAFQIVSSTLRQAELKYRGTWIETTDPIEVPFDSWMLPGHGVTLLWRTVDGAE